MNVFDRMKSRLRARDEPEIDLDAMPLDAEDDGTQLYREDIVAFVKREAERRRTERVAIERQWTLNANFLMGNQWCAINPYRQNGIEDIEPANGWEQRETFNRIAPLYNARDANLSKLKYDMIIKPATADPDDYRKAEISTALLKAAKRTVDFSTLTQTVRSWAEITGNAFYYAWWDNEAGDEYARMETTTIDDEGRIVKSADILRDGDIACCALSPYEILPDNLYKQGMESQKSLIIEQVATTAEIRDTYHIEVQGTNVDVFDIIPSPSTGGYGYISTVRTVSTHSQEDSAKVLTYFERPDGRHPDGRMIVVIGDQLAFYGALPLGTIPVVQQICLPIAGQFFGKSWIEDCIPIQRAYNGIVNKMHDYVRTSAVNTYCIEEGSVEEMEEYLEDGIPYGGVVPIKKGYNYPQPLSPGALPSEVSNELYRLQSEMEYTAGLSHLQLYGDSKNSVTAASAIAQLREVDDTRLAQTAESIRRSILSLARIWLELYKRHAQVDRVIKAVGLDMLGDVIIWNGGDISDNDIEYTTENELLNSPEKQQERFLQAWQMGLFADENGVVPLDIRRRAAELMKADKMGEDLTTDSLQISRAERENALFESGAVPEIGEFDDHELHVQTHERYILHAKFDLLKQRKPLYAAHMEEHLRQHKETIAKKEQAKLMAMSGPAPTAGKQNQTKNHKEL